GQLRRQVGRKPPPPSPAPARPAWRGPTSRCSVRPGRPRSRSPDPPSLQPRVDAKSLAPTKPTPSLIMIRFQTSPPSLQLWQFHRPSARFTDMEGVRSCSCSGHRTDCRWRDGFTSTPWWARTSARSGLSPESDSPDGPRRGPNDIAYLLGVLEALLVIEKVVLVGAEREWGRGFEHGRHLVPVVRLLAQTLGRLAACVLHLVALHRPSSRDSRTRSTRKVATVRPNT